MFIYTRINQNVIFNKQERCVANFSYILSNTVFIGTPIIEGLFSEPGLMICNVFLIPFRSIAYAMGEDIFNPESKVSFKSIINTFIHSRTIQATILAFVLKFLNIHIPIVLINAFSNLNKCISPLSLILVGSMLLQNMHFEKEKLFKVFLICFVRLILLPMLGLVGSLLLKFDKMTSAVIVLLLGMPAASNTAIYARKYHGDQDFASLTVLVCTILSAFTLLLLVNIIELFY